MAAIPFDPYRAQARLAWRNRLARWRAERGQSLFHGAALLALAAIVLLPALSNLEAWGGTLAQAWQRWPGPIAALMFFVFSWRQALAWSRLTQAQARDWLAAQPIAPALRRRARLRALRREAAWQLALLAFAWCGLWAWALRADAGPAPAHEPWALHADADSALEREPRSQALRTDVESVLVHEPRARTLRADADSALEHESRARALRADADLARARAGATPRAAGGAEAFDAFGTRRALVRDAGVAWLALVLGAAIAAPWLAQAVATWKRARVATPVSSVIADRGAGRVWRWQRLACGVALHGRTLAWGALAWLLVPMSGGVVALLAMGAVGIGSALLLGAWRRSLAVLPQAQAWLAAQPLAPGALLRAGWGVPFALLATVALALCALAAALGRPALGALASLVVVAFGALQFAVTAAWRRTPARIALAGTVQAALLLGVLQGFPIAALPLWMVQMIVLLRRARA